MAEETNTKPREDQGRSFGQVLADWGKGALEGAANAGSVPVIKTHTTIINDIVLFFIMICPLL